MSVAALICVFRTHLNFESYLFLKEKSFELNKTLSSLISDLNFALTELLLLKSFFLAHLIMVFA